MIKSVVWRHLRRFGSPLAIVVLPLLGFLADRRLDESLSEKFLPSLLALYLLGILAYAAAEIPKERRNLTLVAAGVLAAGSLVTLMIAIVAIIPALLILLVSLPWLGPPRPAALRAAHFGAGLALCLIALSPWATSYALAQVSLRTARSQILEINTRAIASIALGVCLVAGTMVGVRLADTAWQASRLESFNGEDTGRWELSLNEIRSNWLCGHRRCLMPICYKLMARFGRTSGRCSDFACPFGLAVEAPNVPPQLAAPFMTVYGHSAQEVCAVGD